MDLRAPTPEPVPGPSSDETVEAPESGSSSWRVDRRLTIAKLAGVTVFALAAVFGFPDPGLVIIVGLAALLLAAMAARDLIAPVRLAASPDGLVVTTGFATRRRIAWADVTQIRVDARRGILLRSHLLELDAGDNLYFFSTNELGAPCDEVATRLRALSAR